MNTRQTAAVTVLLAAAVVPVANADITGITTFNNRMDWNNAVGGSPSFLVDFNEFESDTPFDVPLDVGPFSLQHHGDLVGCDGC